MTFRNKTILISGGSRGIGKAIALRFAKDGANIAIASKTSIPNPKLEGTIYSAAEEIENAGGKCLPIVCDIRFEDQVTMAVNKTVEKFGGIDILVNNASAISLSPTLQTEPKRFDLMYGINVRGTFFMSRACLPFLKKSSNPHILTLSPPLNMNPKWFSAHLAYTISKYGMSMVVLGMAEEFREFKIGVNALWPRTTIATAAILKLPGGDLLVNKSRKPEIVAEAAYFILGKSSAETTGNFFIDEEVLKKEGVSDFIKYAVNPKEELMTDLFI